MLKIFSISFWKILSSNKQERIKMLNDNYINLPILNANDIKNSLIVLNSGNKRREYWFGSKEFEIVSIDTTITKIPKENAQ